MDRLSGPGAGGLRMDGCGQASALTDASSPLTIPERLHLALRLKSAPWRRVVEALEPDGSLVDFGCGPGLLAHLLGRSRFRGTYLGLDPDPRKIVRARRWLPELPARSFRVGSVADAPPGAFSQAALIDVLYLVPKDERISFLEAAARALEPGGLFVALTSGGGPRWKRRLDAVQERVAVGLGITQGGTVAICDGAEIARLSASAGLVGANVLDVGRGYTHGFELVSARRPPS